MLQLANILYSRGFAITIMHTSFNAPNPSNYPDFNFHSIHISSLEANEVEVSTTGVTDVIALLTSLNITFVNPFKEALRQLILESLQEEEPVTCLITDADWHFTQEVADSLRLSRIVLRTSNVSSFLAYEPLPLFYEKGYLPVQACRADEEIPEFPPLKAKDLPQVETQRKDDMLHLVDSMMRTIKASAGLIWNTSQDLEHSNLLKSSKLFKVPNFALGPFHKHFPCISKSSLLGEDLTSIPWLNSNQAPRSVLYISFGSIATVTEAEALEIAWGIVNSQQPFLWVVRPKSVENSEWIEFLPEEFHRAVAGKGHIVRWAPQEEVLAHPSTGAFWTHCGWNSILEGICKGVPMICAPSFGDQLVNARYVSDVWKVGIHLEGKVERGVIERAVKKLMVDGGEGEEIRARVGDLKEKMEVCVKIGGSSYEAVDQLVHHILGFCISGGGEASN
uniref:UDP-glycosyltransferase 1 n=1 Tax=Linum usitatissimum TaxID=4006 RepID=I2BH75_LINUS|nr:UDP-glycosyltransferase 1 [Linum usitatissimum]